MLSPGAELSELNTTNLSPIETPFNSVKSKKRKRSQKSGELSDNNPHKKTVTKTPKKMSNPVPNIYSKDMTDDKKPPKYGGKRGRTKSGAEETGKATEYFYAY